jgi:hypothetical protein
MKQDSGVQHRVGQLGLRFGSLGLNSFRHVDDYGPQKIGAAWPCFGNSKDESVTGDLAATGGGTAIGVGLGGPAQRQRTRFYRRSLVGLPVDLVRTPFRARRCKPSLAA